MVSPLAPGKRGLCFGRGAWNSAWAQHVLLMSNQTLGTNMHYSRWPYPWRPEDDWGPIIAAVMLLIIFIILGGLIVSGSGVHL
jgi:hypothetical protein